MANSGPATSGSQFFVVLSESGAQQLKANGEAAPAPSGSIYLYSILGQVTSGMEFVDKIAAVGTPDGAPTTPVTITKVSVTEDGVALEPSTNESGAPAECTLTAPPAMAIDPAKTYVATIESEISAPTTTSTTPVGAPLDTAPLDTAPVLTTPVEISAPTGS
jgi:hypothetical protein